MASQRGQPKGDKRERTRAALIQAAAELVREKGFERTSLEDIARRAGMTRGAIYGNFQNREELFLALVESRWEPVVPPPAPGDGYVDQMRKLADAVVAALPLRRAGAVGAASFQAWTLTHEPMRRRIVEANAETYRRMAAAMAER